MTREMVRDGADHVVVLQVREFSVGRLASMMREHGGADGRQAVDEIVTGARAIVLSSARRRIPIGSVASHIVQVAEIPVVIVPRAGMPSGAESPRPHLMVTARQGL
jgi:nucleotide-binding universal stress UspA family protein